MKDTTINLRISKQLLDLIDKDRGLIPRSAYIRDVLEKKIGYGIQPDKPETQPVKSDNERATNSANEKRKLETIASLKAICTAMTPAQKEEVLNARYQKSTFAKVGSIYFKEPSKDSVAKYWEEIILPELKAR